MGLAERRVAQEFQTKNFPALKTRIEEAAGFPVPIEVNWDALSIEGESRLYAESWTDVYFEPLIEGLKSVTRDQMGKDAVKKELKSIVITNQGGVYYPDNWAKFENGILRLDHEPLTNVADREQRAKKLTELLESKL